MKKKEFLRKLKRCLKNIPKEEAEKSAAFYAEMIDDSMEDGASEEEAVAKLGPPEKVAGEILSDASFMSIVRGGAGRVKEKCGKSPLTIFLIVLGSPLWLSLLVAAAAILFSVAIVLLALCLSLACVWVSVLACSVSGVVGGIMSLCFGDTALGVFVIGVSVALFACSLLLAGPTGRLLKYVLKLSGKWVKGVKRLFVSKRKDKGEEA